MPSIYLGYPCAPQTKEPCVLLSQIHSWTSHWHWLALVSVALQHRKKPLANCIKFWSWLLSKPRTISLLAGCIYIYIIIYIYVYIYMLYSCFPRYFWLGTSKNYSTSSLPDGQPGRMAGLYGRILDNLTTMEGTFPNQPLTPLGLPKNNKPSILPNFIFII